MNSSLFNSKLSLSNNEDILSNNNTYQLTYLERANYPMSQDLIISQLEDEINYRKEKLKNYEILKLQYQELEQDLITLQLSKSTLESEFNSYINANQNQINNLESQKEILLNNLSKKIENNTQIFNKNNSIYIEIENNSLTNKQLQFKVNEQEKLLNKISAEKSKIENAKINIAQDNQININNINILKDQINNLNQETENQIDSIREKNALNIDIVTELNIEEKKNKNLKFELSIIENNINNITENYSKANQVLSALQKDYDTLAKENQQNKSDVQNLTNEIENDINLANIINQKSLNIQQKIGETEMNIKNISKENEFLEKINQNIESNNNNLIIELQGYKQHSGILSKQNEILSKELELIVNRDEEMYKKMDEDVGQKLNKILLNNMDFITNCIDNENNNYMGKNENKEKIIETSNEFINDKEKIIENVGKNGKDMKEANENIKIPETN